MNVSPSLPVQPLFHAPKPARLRGGSSISIGLALVHQVRRGTALWKGSNQSRPAHPLFLPKEEGAVIIGEAAFRNGEILTANPEWSGNGKYLHGKN